MGSGARDTRGRNLIVHRLDDGDLAIVRLGATAADGVRVLRQDYLDLRIDGTAMDPAGTLHVAIAAGGRDSLDQHAVLCSLPLDGALTCANLPFGTGHMQAPSPGVLYILGAGGLSRYDL